MDIILPYSWTNSKSSQFPILQPWTILSTRLLSDVHPFSWIQRFFRCLVILHPLWVVILDLFFQRSPHYFFSGTPRVQPNKITTSNPRGGEPTLVLTGCIIRSGFRIASVNWSRLRHILCKKKELLLSTGRLVPLTASQLTHAHVVKPARKVSFFLQRGRTHHRKNLNCRKSFPRRTKNSKKLPKIANVLFQVFWTLDHLFQVCRHARTALL